MTGFIGLLTTEANVIETDKNLSISIKDRDDIPILTGAVMGQADVFVTGDKELLDLRKIESLAILSPRELWLQFAGLT